MSKKNVFKKYANRDEAVKAARRDVKDYGKRGRFRGVCGRGTHVHVDVFNKNREILQTIHYEWPGAGKERC